MSTETKSTNLFANNKYVFNAGLKHLVEAKCNFIHFIRYDTEKSAICKLYCHGKFTDKTILINFLTGINAQFSQAINKIIIYYS